MNQNMTHKMTLIFDEARDNKLKQLAEKAGISKAAVVRQLIDHAAWHTLAGVPTCADGKRCMVPHMHGHNQQQGLQFSNPTQYEMSLDQSTVCPKDPDRAKFPADPQAKG